MMECEPLSKRPRIEIEQEAAVESGVGANLDEESVERGLIYTITKYCCNSLTLCKRLSEELYLTVLDGVVTLALLLFDKEELYDMGCSRMLADQQKYFWGELEPFADRGDSLYDVCKWIVSKSIDRDQYSLLNEFTVAHMLMIYKSCTYRKDLLIYDEDGDSISIKSPFDDDIEKAIKKAKNHPRLKAEDYSLLLMEIYEDDCVKCQEFLAGKAVECVDVNALYSLEANALQDVVKPNMYPSAYEELDWFIKFDLMMLISIKKMEVRNYSRRGCSIYTLLFNDAVEEGEFNGVDRISRPSVLVSELIQIAELRRKAEGSRFITRDHFVWAFEQRGWGLRSAFKDELASRSAAEDHPPYHIYAIMLRLAIAESALPDVPHLAFAVVFDNLGFSIEEGEVKELKNCFNRFKPAFMGCVRKPKDQSMVSDGGGGADAGTVGGAWCYGNVSIKDFKEHLKGHGGPWG